MTHAQCHGTDQRPMLTKLYLNDPGSCPRRQIQRHCQQKIASALATLWWAALEPLATCATRAFVDALRCVCRWHTAHQAVAAFLDKMRDWVVSEFAAPGKGLGPVLTLDPQAPASRVQIRLASNRSDLSQPADRRQTNRSQIRLG